MNQIEKIIDIATWNRKNILNILVPLTILFSV